ncbi:hypothetical protein L1285_20905 [Pseudoalteromonas sp. DL2-H2.2]|uniref:hypothetical protein n=1 Tax=Pseudoalteromonas sp. DL2-H2.2 TaxID=2908889 RepID=UPI001F226D42|nr:hypothetical protein [Pseudoalteromonas sp. DL2-H2.2]MCF2910771.1 hypothetical protein [Pseudoalteromonas sp. DL2-H2.2]
MSVITTPVKAEHLRIVGEQPEIACDCCKRVERASRPGASVTEWQLAANLVGWRAIQTEHFTFDSVCPKCIADLTAPAAREAV